METGSPQHRLLELAQARGMSLSELSRFIDRNPSYLQQFVRKGSPRKLEETDRRTLARFFDVDESDLGAPEEISSKGAETSRFAEWVDVPRLAVGVSAGPGALNAAEEPVGTFRFSRRWLRQQGLEAENLSLVVVSGDSMSPTLADGDEILVERVTGRVRDGIHVVLVDANTLVKRIDTSRAGRLMLISDNSIYPPMDVSAHEAEVIGRVVWKSGRV